jgi:nucleoid-associated protein YgaU
MPGEDELIEAQQKFRDGLKTILEVLPVITTHTTPVVEGDTLWSLSQKYLGDGQRWRELYLYNIDTITRRQDTHNALPGPDMIFPGAELRYWAF